MYDYLYVVWVYNEYCFYQLKKIKKDEDIW
jgi:hypothetical protein